MGPGSPNRKGHIRGTCTWHLLALNTLILCSCWINHLQVAGAYTVVMWDVATITVELVLICRHLHQYNQLVQKLFLRHILQRTAFISSDQFARVIVC